MKIHIYKHCLAWCVCIYPDIFLFVIQTYKQLHFGVESAILNKQEHLIVVPSLLRAGRGGNGIVGDRSISLHC